MSTLDLASHGYVDADVVRFSYAGGIVPPTEPGWSRALGAAPYGGADTFLGIGVAVESLGALLVETAAAQPGVPIDIYGHSLGGLVARYALVAADLDTIPIGVAVTFASPHQGTPSADIIGAVDAAAGPAGRAVAEGVGIADFLSSPVIDELGLDGLAGRSAEVAFPDRVHAVTIGARGDVVVPASSAWAPGASHVVIDGGSPFTAHSDVVGTRAASREVALALAGVPPACEGVVDRFFDWAVPGLIGAAEQGVAAVLDAATLLDGPAGPDSPRPVAMAIDSVRAKPGRFGVPHELHNRENFHGSHFHEAVAGSRRPLRSSDPSLEPQDEAVHLRRSQRSSHYRSAADRRAFPASLLIHPQRRR